MTTVNSREQPARLDADDQSGCAPTPGEGYSGVNAGTHPIWRRPSPCSGQHQQQPRTTGMAIRMADVTDQTAVGLAICHQQHTAMSG